jgi:hypothetical protein
VLRKAAEGLHHTPEQVALAFSHAQEWAEGAGYPTPENQPLVVAMAQHLLSKQVVFEQVGATGVVLNRHPLQG